MTVVYAWRVSARDRNPAAGDAQIYVLIDPRNGEIRYVGWTSGDLRTRLARHMRSARRGQYHRARWLAQLARYGMEPHIEPVHTVSASSWAEAERYWIGYFREMGCRLTNGTDGGEGTPGQRHTALAKARMSAAKRHPRGPREAMSPKQKAKLREAATRQMADPAMRAAVSRVHAGKTISAHHKQAVGEATSRRWEAWRRKRFPDDLAARYDAGAATMGTLAEECGVSVPSMRRELLAQGATLRRGVRRPLKRLTDNE